MVPRNVASIVQRREMRRCGEIGDAHPISGQPAAALDDPGDVVQMRAHVRGAGAEPRAVGMTAAAHLFVNPLMKEMRGDLGEELAVGAWQHKTQIDHEIRKHTKNWDFDRIARVDLAILRLAIHELLNRLDIPPIVSINEAIDLSKVYSSPDSKRFINGILDRLKDNLDRPLRTAMH